MEGDSAQCILLAHAIRDRSHRLQIHVCAARVQCGPPQSTYLFADLCRLFGADHSEFCDLGDNLLYSAQLAPNGATGEIGANISSHVVKLESKKPNNLETIGNFHESAIMTRKILKIDNTFHI